jgi:hypothetical protein
MINTTMDTFVGLDVFTQTELLIHREFCISLSR